MVAEVRVGDRGEAAGDQEQGGEGDGVEVVEDKEAESDVEGGEQVSAGMWRGERASEGSGEV